MFDVLVHDGWVLDGSGLPAFRADVGIVRDRIAAIGRMGLAEARQRINATGHVVCPGFVDAHVHGDLMLLADPYHEPAIRQGVTTYIIGQDGESMAPGSPGTVTYMRHYTAGFNGNPDLAESGQRLSAFGLPDTGRAEAVLTVDAFLSLFDRRSALNVAYLIPNGNVRMEAMGLETRVPSADELRHMRRLVREGMEQGAVGLSSGLDYIPSRYAETAELIALCEEIAPYGGVYVTHMRRYDPEGLAGSMEEVFTIGRKADVAVHISHFNSQAKLAIPLLDNARESGIDATFDLYCYLAGSTILGMVALPPWVQEGGIEPTVQRLRDPATRKRLQESFDRPRGPLELVRLSHITSPDYRQYEGKTLGEAAATAGLSIADFVCEVLVASNMVVGCVAPHLRRGEEDVQELMRHPAMMAGSDGIYIGSRPHPRGWGCFARYLGPYVRDTRTWSLEEAVAKLSYHPARRFGLKDRGLIREGLAADVVVFDPAAIQDRSTYENGRQLAIGVRDVLVNGTIVLQAGQRTRELPGRGLRRG